MVRPIITPFIYTFTFIGGVCIALTRFNIIISYLNVVFDNIVFNPAFTSLIYTNITSIIYISIT